MQTCEMAGQMSLFGQDGYAGKMCREFSAHPRGKTSASSSRKSAELIAIPYLFLDLTPGHGNLLGESYWELRSPWRGGSWTVNTGVSPREGRVCSLSQILEVSPHRKYYLSRRACLGILRRAHERGRELPPQLEAALMAQAGLALPINGARIGHSRELTAAFCAGAGKKAGGIGYSEQVAPTLKGGSGGNIMPSVLCLNDQGGSIMDCSEDMSGTLRAQAHGHEPLVMATQQGGAEIMTGICPTITAAAGMSGNNQPVLYENHGIASRYRGPLPVAPTLSARAGTGGNNLSLVSQPTDSGTQLLYSRQRVDVFRDGEVASTQSARQYKDATDLVCQPMYQETVGTLTSDDYKGPNSQYVGQDKLIVDGPMLIRRLTPLECERLMGLPDGWTDLPGAADSARYRALGNSVAINCVEYIMRGLAMAAG